MEQLLLQLINEHAPQSYSDSTNQAIAAYLIGQIKFEKIRPLLKIHKIHWFTDDPKTRKIARDLSQDKENLLPPLGRYCRVIRYTGGERRLFHFISTTIKGAVTTPELYKAGGMEMEDLIADILSTLPEYWGTDSKSLGFESYLNCFEYIYKTHPEALEKLARDGSKPGFSLFASTYLYAADWAKYKHLEDKIINLSGQLINKKSADEAFEAASEEAYFTNSSYLKPLQKHSRKNASAKADKFAMDLFFFAYATQPTPPILLDLINYLLIYCEKNNAFSSTTRAHTIIGGMNADGLYDTMLPKVLKGACPMPHFLANVVTIDHSLKNHLDKAGELALKHEAATLKALKMTDLRGGMALLSAFWEKGRLMEKLQEYEKKVLLTLGTKDENLMAYFLGTTKELPNRVPNLEINEYNLAWNIACMVAYSPLPARLVTFALSFNTWPNFFGNLLWNIREYYGNEFATKFVDEVDAPAHEKIASLITVSFYWHSNEAFFINEAARLAKEDTSLYEKAFPTASAEARATILAMAYKQQPDYNPDWLISCIQDASKRVRDLAVEYLTLKPELKPQIENLATSKKKAQREAAEKLLIAYNAPTSSETTDFDALTYVIQNIPTKAAKAIEWTDFETLPKVRLNDSDDLADDRIIAGYIYLMTTQTEMALPQSAKLLRESLNKSDLCALGRQLFHIWKNNKAPAKQKTVLALAAIDGDDEFVRELTKDITSWAEASRGALAAEATRALALQGGSLALMTVDSFSKKFKNKQVKRVAEEAFRFAAQELGVDPEVLGDRIVPNLGFDNRGQQTIDYGNRQFVATITPDLQISLKNDQGKAIKTLPTVGVSDNTEIATAAKAAFTAMKKSLKSVTSLQCLRLEQALSNNRTWDTKAWSQLFVENPIMNMFAIGLIWGTYDKDGNLIDSFRYMEDGSFVTVEEDELILSDDAQVGLCHPLDLGEMLTAQWKQQLEDYEIKQPVDQLNRKVFLAPAGDNKADSVIEFGGAVVYAISLLGKLQKAGWYKGSVVDAGGFFNFYKEDTKQGIGVLLNFSGSYIGVDNSEEVTIYDAVFYKAGTVTYGSYIYDEVKKEDRIPLHQVPKRFYSEACYDIERAVANRLDTVEKWEKNRRY
ncbi:MAG: DUF4132 domain-containing protein [Defluviitaleaceae bacterium]|nr:DUF4132 domain-containing protein [Defluviitaleaceae bacterium]